MVPEGWRVTRHRIHESTRIFTRYVVSTRQCEQLRLYASLSPGDYTNQIIQDAYLSGIHFPSVGGTRYCLVERRERLVATGARPCTQHSIWSTAEMDMPTGCLAGLCYRSPFTVGYSALVLFVLTRERRLALRLISTIVTKPCLRHV